MRSDRWWLVAGIAALIMVFLWVFHPTAQLWPWGTDAERWLERGDPANHGWATWVFGTRHFVGYRPVAALSYAIDALFFPPGPASHRVDFAAMSATLAAVAWVGRALLLPWTSPARATMSGLAAAGIVLLHPVIQEIAPYIPRRSYVLAEATGLAALACFLTGLRHAPRTWLLGGWGVASALLLGLACGSNEAIFPIAILLPIFAAEAHGRPGLRSALLPLLPVVSLALVRNFVLPDDNLTGYVNKWFAYADGHNRLLKLDSPQPFAVLKAAWSYVLFPSSPTGDPALYSGLLGVLGGVVAVWFLLRAGIDPLLGRRDPARRLPGWLLLWACVTATLYALANTWFWREGFPLLIPVSLAVVSIAAVDLQRSRPWWRIASTAVGVFLLVGSIAWWSPLFRMDLSPLGEEVRATRALDQVVEARKRLVGPATVWIVSQGDEGFARALAKAATEQSLGSGIVYRPLGWSSGASTAAAKATAIVGAGRVRPAPGGRIDPRIAPRLHIEGSTDIDLGKLARLSRARAEVWWWEGRDHAVLRTQSLPTARP